MNKSVATLIVFLGLIGGIGFLSWNFLIKDDMKTYIKDKKMNIKNTITMGKDGFIGYSKFESSKLRDLLREDGIKLDLIDDGGNYEQRIKKLKSGAIDIAAMPIHDFVEIYGNEYGEIGYNSPLIISAISESKGADAIVANSKYKNIDSLKGKNISSSYTSKFLLGSLAIDSNNKNLLKNATFNPDIQKSYDGLMDGTYDVVALWEPLVTKAKRKGYKVLIDSSDIKKGKIIDVLIVNENYLKNNKETLESFIHSYFKTVQYYEDNEIDLLREISNSTGEDMESLDLSLKGVKTYQLTDNINFLFDVDYNGKTGGGKHEIYKYSEEIISRLIQMDSIKESNILDNNIKKICDVSILRGVANKDNILSSKKVDFKNKEYSIISDSFWEKMIDNPKFTRDDLSINFLRNGDLDEDSKVILSNFMENQISNFDYYIAIVGKNARVAGIDKAILKERTLKKANKVMDYIKNSYEIKENRFKAFGFGTRNVPIKKSEDNYYEYLNINNKVELVFIDY